ncbi:hypothetical protein SDC9_120135 [bioreactor metagenome]|uniref:Uncharacterized protein n=1 Tax=bioreactor metagenome TaxID=1076179 RepID=A0A645C688_9ZZZZ
MRGNALHRANHVRQFTHAGRLNQNAVGRILGQHLFKCLAKVTHQAAADAAGVHFGDLDAGLF